VSSTLKPYPAYKDSGVPWLGEIPAHWEGSMTQPVIPAQAGVIPAQAGVIPAQAGVIPAQAGVIPAQAGIQEP
jgi:hypothetical protein